MDTLLYSHAKEKLLIFWNYTTVLFQKQPFSEMMWK